MKVLLAVFQRSLIVLVLVLSAADAIKCFQCNSVYNPDCLSLNATRVHKIIVDCDEVHHRKNLTATFCRNIYQKANGGHERVTRSCGFLPQIYTPPRINRCTRVSFVDSTYSTYCECSTDLCNDAASLVIKKGFVLTSLLLLLFAHIIRHFL